MVCGCLYIFGQKEMISFHPLKNKPDPGSTIILKIVFILMIVAAIFSSKQPSYRISWKILVILKVAHPKVKFEDFLTVDIQAKMVLEKLWSGRNHSGKWFLTFRFWSPSIVTFKAIHIYVYKSLKETKQKKFKSSLDIISSVDLL